MVLTPDSGGTGAGLNSGRRRPESIRSGVGGENRGKGAATPALRIPSRTLSATARYAAFRWCWRFHLFVAEPQISRLRFHAFVMSGYDRYLRIPAEGLSRCRFGSGGAVKGVGARIPSRSAQIDVISFAPGRQEVTIFGRPSNLRMILVVSPGLPATDPCGQHRCKGLAIFRDRLPAPACCLPTPHWGRA